MPYVVLNWNANPATDNVRAYDIWRGTGTSVAFGSCAKIGSVDGTAFTDTTVAYSTSYTYYIVADNAAGSSLPDGPFNITASAPGSTYVQNAGSAPSLQEGTLASRPAAGTAGRLYVETDNKVLDRDNGTSWDTIGLSYPVPLPPVAAPSAPSTGFLLYCDTADGRLKVISSTGTITEIAQP